MASTRTCPCGIDFEPTNNRQEYCSKAHSQKARDRNRGRSSLPLSVDWIALLFYRGGNIGMGYVDRSRHRPLRRGEVGWLFCRVCDSYLGDVVDGTFSRAGDTIVRDGKVACSELNCYELGRLTWTPMSHAIPAIPREQPSPKSEPRFAEHLKWETVTDDSGITVAAVCVEAEPIAAAA